MSVEPLLNCVSQKLSVNLSVLTNRQKFCIRLPKWVFVKVDNRLKVTSFGDPQHQETTITSSLGPQSPRVFPIKMAAMATWFVDPSVLGFIFLRVTWSKRQGLVTKGKKVFNTLWIYSVVKVKWQQLATRMGTHTDEWVHQVLITTGLSLVSQIQISICCF